MQLVKPLYGGGIQYAKAKWSLKALVNYAQFLIRGSRVSSLTVCGPGIGFDILGCWFD